MSEVCSINTARGWTVHALCKTGCGKAARLDAIIADFAKRARQSASEPEHAIAFLRQWDVRDMRSLHRALVERTVYAGDPHCQDYAQTLARSLRRMEAEGVFGDCAAYAVAVAALAHALGVPLEAQRFVLLGDVEDRGRHIVNLIDRNRGLGQPDWVVVDATEADGYGWTIPPDLNVVQTYDIETGTQTLHPAGSQHVLKPATQEAPMPTNPGGAKGVAGWNPVRSVRSAVARASGQVRNELARTEVAVRQEAGRAVQTVGGVVADSSQGVQTLARYGESTISSAARAGFATVASTAASVADVSALLLGGGQPQGALSDADWRAALTYALWTDVNVLGRDGRYGANLDPTLEPERAIAIWLGQFLRIILALSAMRGGAGGEAALASADAQLDGMAEATRARIAPSYQWDASENTPLARVTSTLIAELGMSGRAEEIALALARKRISRERFEAQVAGVGNLFSAVQTNLRNLGGYITNPASALQSAGNAATRVSGGLYNAVQSAEAATRHEAERAKDKATTEAARPFTQAWDEVGRGTEDVKSVVNQVVDQAREWEAKGNDLARTAGQRVVDGASQVLASVCITAPDGTQVCPAGTQASNAQPSTMSSSSGSSTKGNTGANAGIAIAALALILLAGTGKK